MLASGSAGHGTEQLAWREQTPGLSSDSLHRDVTSEKCADVDAITHALHNCRSGQLAEFRGRRHLIATEDHPRPIKRDVSCVQTKAGAKQFALLNHSGSEN